MQIIGLDEYKPSKKNRKNKMLWLTSEKDLEIYMRLKKMKIQGCKRIIDKIEFLTDLYEGKDNQEVDLNGKEEGNEGN